MGETEDGFGVNESEVSDFEESQQEETEEVGEGEMDAVVQSDILGEVGPIVFVIAEEKVEWMGEVLGKGSK